MLDNWSTFSGARSVSSVPAGSFANALPVGANTVKGPSPDRASTKLAAVKASTRVVNLSSPTAVSTIDLHSGLSGGGPELITADF